jgi:DNA-binding beta-propeller fold protein YncE
VWGTPGAADGQFDTPRGIAVAPDGSVYVVDTRNNRIEKFDAQGRFLLAWGGLGKVEEGSGDAGRFNEPWGVAVGPDGAVYVADTWNHRVQKFDPNGQFLTLWGVYGPAAAGPTSFWGPRGLAVDESNQVFVTDTGNKRVVVFDAQGNFVSQIGSPGYEDGQLDEPVGVAVGPEGRVYVADTWNHRVQWFVEVGLNQFAYGGQWAITGWDSQSLNNKPYLTVGKEGRVFVADPDVTMSTDVSDPYGYRILEFTADGQFVAAWGDFGAANNQFGSPVGLATDSTGRVYVVDSGNNRVMVFPPPGK